MTSARHRSAVNGRFTFIWIWFKVNPIENGYSMLEKSSSYLICMFLMVSSKFLRMVISNRSVNESDFFFSLSVSFWPLLA